MVTYSIVIPVYNTEKLLDECVKSVLAQNSSSKFEIILVDDGSTDRSGDICDEFARRYPVIRSIHQANQGVSVARNTGIAAAHGQYILFLDSDDYWSEDLLANLDPRISQNPDIIEFGYQKVYESCVCETVLPAILTQGESGMEYLDSLFESACMPIASSCTSAYRQAFLASEKILFSVSVQYGEDFDFRMRCLKHAQSVIGIGQALYKYRMNAESTTHVLSPKKIYDLLSTCIMIYRLHPSALLANYYCKEILKLARLNRRDAQQLNVLLDENRDILNQISGKKSRVVRTMFQVFGWYNASKLVQLLVWIKHFGKVKE